MQEGVHIGMESGFHVQNVDLEILCTQVAGILAIYASWVSFCIRKVETGLTSLPLLNGHMSFEFVWPKMSFRGFLTLGDF